MPIVYNKITGFCFALNTYSFKPKQPLFRKTQSYQSLSSKKSQPRQLAHCILFPCLLLPSFQLHTAAFQLYSMLANFVTH
jgi:hypothetical protein